MSVSVTISNLSLLAILGKFEVSFVFIACMQMHKQLWLLMYRHTSYWTIIIIVIIAFLWNCIVEFVGILLYIICRTGQDMTGILISKIAPKVLTK